jgi:7,8-dihydropterin-6-yl-methyl-4-(beta-D-ribofuranosyl)aminobenzene 5'-phosphate synthase
MSSERTQHDYSDVQKYERHRELVRRYHPDAGNEGEPERIRRVNAACRSKATFVMNVLLMCIAAIGPPAGQAVARNQSAPRIFHTRTERAPVITVVYDNNPSGKGMETAWGFSCLVQGMEKTVLFDTGGDGKVLLANMERLGIVPREIDAVVVSHIHGDHTGGLHALLAENRQILAYLPDSFPVSFFRDTKRHGTKVIAVKGPMKICDGVYSTGELGDSPREQSLVVDTARGLVIITGCAHPGIERIVRAVKERFGGEIFLVLGGFHLAAKGREEIDAVIAGMKALGVRCVAPCHCTGDMARSLFKKAFGAGYIDSGVGTVIDTGRLR